MQLVFRFDFFYVSLSFLRHNPIRIYCIDQVLIIVEYFFVKAEVSFFFNEEVLVLLRVGSSHNQVDDCNHNNIDSRKEKLA
jgi:hypothetical protein